MIVIMVVIIINTYDHDCNHVIMIKNFNYENFNYSSGNAIKKPPAIKTRH